MSAVLPYIGFAPLRPGRIHMFCPTCGRKQSNMRRGEFDPPSAVVMLLGCEKCDQGCKDYEPIYRDARGRQVWFR